MRTRLETDLNGIPHSAYWNCNDESWQELFTLDAEAVWYDSLHYNLYGAVPFTELFAHRLTRIFNGSTVCEETSIWEKRAAQTESLLHEKPPTA